MNSDSQWISGPGRGLQKRRSDSDLSLFTFVGDQSSGQSSSKMKQRARFIIQTASELAVHTKTPDSLEINIDQLNCPECFDMIAPKKLL